MPGRRVRLKLFGDGWIAYGGARIPDNREVVVTESEAAAFLRHRGSSRRVEIVGWIEDSDEDDVSCPRDPSATTDLSSR